MNIKYLVAFAPLVLMLGCSAKEKTDLSKNVPTNGVLFSDAEGKYSVMVATQGMGKVTQNGTNVIAVAAVTEVRIGTNVLKMKKVDNPTQEQIKKANAFVGN